jgi:tetratricopeptide (TPR) repeat protein
VYQAELWVSGGEAPRAVTAIERVLERQHARAAAAGEIVDVLEPLGGALAAAGRHADALTRYRRALELREELEGKEQPSLVSALTGAARANLALDRPSDAVPLLERAHRLSTAARTASETAEIEMLLAQALWGSRGDQARALDLATHALSVSDSEKLRTEIAAWLRARAR